MNANNNEDQEYFGLKPGDSSVSIPLSKDEELPAEGVRTLSELPKLNNLCMFARVPRCFNTLMNFPAGLNVLKCLT
jgi:hypothetical protein